MINRLLGAATAAALAIDAAVHAVDAPLSGGGVINEAGIFHVESGVAALTAVLVLVRPRRGVWMLALGVAASALAAVLVYRYVNVGAVGPIPNLYDPTWQEPGKVLSAFAEGTAVLLSLVGLAVTRSAPALRVWSPP